MADYDIIIKGGTAVDGTLTPRFVSDIATRMARSPKSAV
jgi:N-acyl-D-aspartate/D-glutamate deacylase